MLRKPGSVESGDGGRRRIEGESQQRFLFLGMKRNDIIEVFSQTGSVLFE